MAKKSGSKPMTKTEIMRSISETTNLAKKDVVAVMEALTTEIQKSLKGSGSGVFSIPGLGNGFKGFREDRASQGSRPSGSEGCQEPLHRRAAGSSGEAGQREGSGSRAEEPQGDGLRLSHGSA